MVYSDIGSMSANALSAALWRVGLAGSKYRPDDACVLGSEGDDCFLVAASSDQRLSPHAEPIGALGEHVKRGARSVHEQRSEVDIAAFGDAPEARFASGWSIGAARVRARRRTGGRF